MLYKIINPVLVFSDNSINASGMIVRSEDAGATWQDVQPFETSIAKTTDADIIAGAMGALALQLAIYDASVTQVKADVAALLASPAYTVDL
jgi:hypothetical protein